MKKLIWILAIIFSVVCAIYAVGAWIKNNNLENFYSVDNLNMNVIINKDGSMDITEDIVISYGENKDGDYHEFGERKYVLENEYLTDDYDLTWALVENIEIYRNGEKIEPEGKYLYTMSRL